MDYIRNLDINHLLETGKKPRNIVKVAILVLSVVVLAAVNSSYILNECLFANTPSTCNFQVFFKIITIFLAILFIVYDFFLSKQFGHQDKVLKLDLLISACVAFIDFILFCVMTNKWTTSSYPSFDAPRTAIAFTFFTMLAWVISTLLAFQEMRATDPFILPSNNNPASMNNPQPFNQSNYVDPGGSSYPGFTDDIDGIIGSEQRHDNLPYDDK